MSEHTLWLSASQSLSGECFGGAWNASTTRDAAGAAHAAPLICTRSLVRNAPHMPMQRLHDALLSAAGWASQALAHAGGCHACTATSDHMQATAGTANMAYSTRVGSRSRAAATRCACTTEDGREARHGWG